MSNQTLLQHNNQEVEMSKGDTKENPSITLDEAIAEIKRLTADWREKNQAKLPQTSRLSIKMHLHPELEVISEDDGPRLLDEVVVDGYDILSIEISIGSIDITVQLKED
ncbi:hypothetical protein N9L18_01210 [Candidatus Pacebacteria bacterium]|nr:hypothetical protein [Candidatus Paceibacterota bacterium]